MKTIALALAVITSMGVATQLKAEQITCQLTDWKGSEDLEASISWTGTSFIADMNNINIKTSGSGFDSLGWVSARAKRNSKFITFSFKDLATSGDSSKNHQAQFDYRIYKTGKCSVYVKVGQFAPIVASGRVK